MLRPRVTLLPPHIQAVFVQNALKLYARVVARAEEDEAADGEGGADETAREAAAMVTQRLPLFIQSADLEVQERVRWSLYFWEFLRMTWWKQHTVQL